MILEGYDSLNRIKDDFDHEPHKVMKSKINAEERAMIDAYLASGGTVRKYTQADYWAKVHKDEAKQRRRGDFNRFAGSIR